MTITQKCLPEKTQLKQTNYTEDIEETWKKYDIKKKKEQNTMVKNPNNWQRHRRSS